MKNQNQMK